MRELRRELLADDREFARLRVRSPVLATWDDDDDGLNQTERRFT